MFFKDRFVVLNMIGCGGFGKIYQAMDKSRGHNVAIKFDKSSFHSNHLYNEYELYRKLMKNNYETYEGFANCYGYLQLDNSGHYCLVLEQLYKDLDKLFFSCQKSFPIKTIAWIAIEAINRLETIHDKNFIYLDIKPENFMIGFPGMDNSRRIHLIDFGLAKEFPSVNNHNKKVRGSLMYMSARTHFQQEQSFRDDLESLAYMLLYFLNGGKLPWSIFENLNYLDSFQKCIKIGSMKLALPSEQLFNGYPEEFAEFLNYVVNLKFAQRPDYQMIRKMFSKFTSDNDGIFIWENV